MVSDFVSHVLVPLPVTEQILMETTKHEAASGQSTIDSPFLGDISKDGLFTVSAI